MHDVTPVPDEPTRPAAPADVASGAAATSSTEVGTDPTDMPELDAVRAAVGRARDAAPSTSRPGPAGEAPAPGAPDDEVAALTDAHEVLRSTLDQAGRGPS